MRLIEIVDATTGEIIEGKLLKRYPFGLTIEDARDVRHYATYDRVLSDISMATPLTNGRPAENAPLFS